MKIDDFFGAMTGADRQRWLTRTERELSVENARLATCRRLRLSTLGAEIGIQALNERKASLLKTPRPSISAASTARPIEREGQAARDAWAKKERERWAQTEQDRMLAEFKARQERDARLKRYYGP